MDILMSGQIYIKRDAEPFKLSDEQKSFIDRLGRKSIDNQNLNSWYDRFSEIESKEGQLDYSGCDQFWVSIIEEDGIRMTEQAFYYDYEKKYKDKEKMEKDFVSLLTFLEKGTYVGRYFKRTEPLVMESGREDKSFVPDEYGLYDIDAPLVLYEYDGILLTVERNMVDRNRDFYKIIEKRYTKDGKFEYEGKQNDEYMDKSAIYQAVLKQLDNLHKAKSM